MNILPLKKGSLKQSKFKDFEFWTKMTTKCKPQGPKCKKFEIWTKMAKVPKPQGPKWQFTLLLLLKKHHHRARPTHNPSKLV
ncbi:hypothetical protein Hanom_Chr12g01085251 [Helianthus anomalus]